MTRNHPRPPIVDQVMTPARPSGIPQRYVRSGPTLAQRIAAEYALGDQMAKDATKPLKRGLKGKRRRKR